MALLGLLSLSGMLVKNGIVLVDEIQLQLASGVPPKDVAKNLGVSIPTLYRWVPAATHA